MQPMRARNDIKVNASCNYRFLYQQWFCNPNYDSYDSIAFCLHNYVTVITCHLTRM